MWQAEVRKMIRHQSPPEAFRGIADRILPDPHNVGGLVPLFALYLGSRADLLPLDDCKALLSAPHYSRPLPVDGVAEILREKLGSGAAELIETLEPAAREVDPLLQVHGARTRTGESVLVRVLRPDARETAEKGFVALRSVLGRSPFERDFRRFVYSRMDLSQEAASLGTLMDDGRDLGIMDSLRVLGRFCAPGVLVTEDDGQFSASEPFPASDVYSAWIRQAVMGRVFAPEPLRFFRRLRAGGPAGMSGGSLVQTSESSRRNIARYLLALCAEDSERAADALLAESEPARGALNDETVRQRFRFSVPERDSPLEWLDRPSTISHCITHWRLLARSGWEPRHALLAFLRGLTVLTARNPLNAEQDPLLECLDEIRPHLLVFRARKILDGLQNGRTAELGRRLVDQAPVGLVAAADRPSSQLAFGSRLLLLAAAGILAPSVAALAGRSGEALTAGVVLVAGISTLAACRPRTGVRWGWRLPKLKADSEDPIG
jgi:hypothetical protein